MTRVNVPLFLYPKHAPPQSLCVALLTRFTLQALTKSICTHFYIDFYTDYNLKATTQERDKEHSKMHFQVLEMVF